MQHQEWYIERERLLGRIKELEAENAELRKRLAEDALQRLKALIEPMVEHHSKEIGVKPPFVYYKAMISRWGVCNVKDKSICFSAYLLLLPEWCVEHVVVHELCHLLEPSHNARFHALMDKFFPRWTEARRETRRLLKSPAA